MTEAGRVLVLNDDRDVFALISDMLSLRSFNVIAGHSHQDVVPQVSEVRADVLLADVRLPGANGLDVCRRLAEARPDIPVIVLTSPGSLDTAIQAVRVGAYDFVTTPIDADVLAVVVSRAVRHRRLEEEVRRLRAEGSRGSEGVTTLLGDSAPMRRVRELVRQVADLDVTLLITGESGTGKEAAARALHVESSRRSGPFVTFNCAGVPEHLFESQLFGHVRGVMTETRVDRDRAGLFQEAAAGTLFIDETSELSLASQAKLLRTLQERTVRPLGGGRDVPVTARLVFAATRPLEAAVAAGTFREDLFFRLSAVRADLPPLRARREDVLTLAHHFLQRTAERTKRPVRGISSSAAALLLEHHWPGNVRELRHAMERAAALSRSADIAADDLPHPQLPRMPAQAHEGSGLVTLDEVERRHVLTVLAAVNNSKKRASAILGVDPKTLYRKLLQWGVHVEREVQEPPHTLTRQGTARSSSRDRRANYTTS